MTEAETIGRLQFSVVAFMDILRFAKMVEEDSAAGEPRHLPRILSVVRHVAGHADARGLDLRVFSDSMTVAVQLSPRNALAALKTVADLQLRATLLGVLVRGGLALGKHYADERVVFSEALVRAYRLESDHARVPRVLVDDDLIDWFLHHGETNDEMREQMAGVTLRDRDGRAFVHYLTEEALGRHREVVEEVGRSPEIASQSVMEKFHWLVGYHDFTAEDLKRLDARIKDPPRFGRLRV